ncbi:MAG: CocE/NonD family hydrolase [Streptosporangiaceae bacterium]
MTDQQATRVTAELDVPVRMRDGTILRANVFRPAATPAAPVLLMRLPYGKDLPPSVPAVDPVQAARRGYVTVVQDTRGRYASAGTWDPFRHEGEDGLDTIEWAAGLPYSDGQVGMYGQSYMGFTQWSAALAAPAQLKAIAPAKTWRDPLNGFFYRGGALELGLLASWHLGVLGPDLLARRFDGDATELERALTGLIDEHDSLASAGYRSLPVRDFEPLLRHDVVPSFFDFAHSPMARSVIDHLTIAGKEHLVTVPSLNIAGWYDLFIQDGIDSYNAMRALGVPSKLVIGPWHHGSNGSTVGEIDFGMRSNGDWLDLSWSFTGLQLRWFDHWLRRADNGVDAEPEILIFVMGANRWRTERSWPLPRAVDTNFYLHPDRRLGPEPPVPSTPDTYAYDPSDPVPTRGGAALMSPEFPPGAYDQSVLETRPDVLSYTTDVLQASVEVTGNVTAHLWAASDCVDTDFVVRLCDVYPDGRSIGIADGIVRAQFRDHSRAPSLITPGQPYEYRIDLWATSNVFLPGHRLRVDVTSSCFPRWDRNLNNGNPAAAYGIVARQTVLHDPGHPSRLVLPLVA